MTALKERVESRAKTGMTGDQHIQLYPKVVPIPCFEEKRVQMHVAGIMPGSRAIVVADMLVEEAISLEVIDPRTIRPLDLDCIYDSAGETRRIAVVHGAPKTGGTGPDI